MESNVKALLGERISNRLSGTLAAGFDINIANALVSVVVERKANLATVDRAAVLTGNGTGFFSFLPNGERRVA